jgi:hypothetical protein
VGLKLNGTHQILAYAVDMNLLGEKINAVKKKTVSNTTLQSINCYVLPYYWVAAFERICFCMYEQFQILGARYF